MDREVLGLLISGLALMIAGAVLLLSLIPI